ncbi:MAG: hypothetical protein WBB27_13075 [Maribacter sp.]
MKNYTIAVLACLFLGSCGNKKNKTLSETKAISEMENPKTTLTLISETNDLPRLESVILDEKRNVLYVSIQNGEEPGDGSIAMLSATGEILNPSFTLGLNEPKGMAIVGDLLYVGDLLELIEIDLETGTISNTYTAENVRYFNDVTADEAGNVYVSDMHASSIYKLDTEKNFREWFTSPDIESANGLLVDGDELIIGGWGYFTDGQALNAGIGKLHKMNLKTQELVTITTEPLGNLDGIQAFDGSSYFVTDWKQGKLFKVNKDGSSEELLDTEQGAADIWYIQDKNALLLPLNKENKLAFYHVD